MEFNFFGLRKKADTGIGNFGTDPDSLSPNTHNENNYYSGDCWSRTEKKQSETFQPGTEGTGTYALDTINPQVRKPNSSGTPFDEADRAKQFALPKGNEKHVQKDDADEIIETVKWSVASAGFTLNKTARIVKVPNKNKYRILSEKGKNLGEYDSKEKAEKRLKQIEMFKHMDKKAAPMYYNFNGQTMTDEAPVPVGGVIPVDRNPKSVKPITMPQPPVTPCNVPGCAQDDSGLARAEEDCELDVEAKVVGDVHGKVTQDVTDGSSGFSATRGGRGARGSAAFVFNKEAASRVKIMPETNTSNTATPRNDQTPYNQDGKGCSSYSDQELEEIKKTPNFLNMKPIDTAVPTTFTERLYNVDNEKMVEGTEFGTWDFFINPTNQNLGQDSLTDEEKKESKERSTNKIY